MSAPRRIVIEKKRQKKRRYDFSRYINRVKDQKAPDQVLTRQSMIIMNDFVNDMENRIATVAKLLAAKDKRNTIITRDIALATAMVLGIGIGENPWRNGYKEPLQLSQLDLKPNLSGLAMREGLQALENYRKNPAPTRKVHKSRGMKRPRAIKQPRAQPVSAADEESAVSLMVEGNNSSPTPPGELPSLPDLGEEALGWFDPEVELMNDDGEFISVRHPKATAKGGKARTGLKQPAKR